MATVPFGDLKRQYQAHSAQYDGVVRSVMERGWFVLGGECEAFETEFAAWCGARYCVGCNSGTDAITLALLAHGIQAEDRVVTVANTCVPTVAGIGAAHAQIGLCDADAASALMDVSSLERELSERPAKAIVPVHLYGQAANIDLIYETAMRHAAVVVEDGAQAHGAMYKGKRVGSHGGTVAWSFYPSKNLGAFGDAGAVTTHSEAVAVRLRMLRNYGQEKRYHHSIRGINSRLDELQAAVLRTRLPRLEAENVRRQKIAERYRAEIKNPQVKFIGGAPHSTGCEHLFPISCRDRDAMQSSLKQRNVECLIHYPIAVHMQRAYVDLGYKAGDFPNAEKLCAGELSLPMYPELSDEEVGQVIDAINKTTIA